MTETEVKTEEVQEQEESQNGSEDAVEIIRPKAEPKTWILKLGPEQRKFTQKPLSYFGKMEFYSLVGETVDTALQTGLTVNNMLDAAPGLSTRDFSNVDSFLLAISKLLRYAPDLLKDCYCVWLDVPYEDRPWAKVAMEDLSDDEGLEIIEIFLDQNYAAIENFFRTKIQALIERVQELRKVSASQQSNNSKATRATTRKPSKKS